MRKACALSVVALAGSASANEFTTPIPLEGGITKTVQQDINGAEYQAFDSLGAPMPFSGVMHTGSVVFGMGDGTTHLGISVQTGAGNPFVGDPNFVGTMTDFSMTLVLNSGILTGGSVFVEMNGNSTFTGSLSSGFVTDVTNGFTIDLAGGNAGFSNSNFGGANVGPWVGMSNTVSGIVFNFAPSPEGMGFGDVDIFAVPAPATGLALLGLAVPALRRRR